MTMGKKRKMMIGAAVVVAGILIGATVMWKMEDKREKAPRSPVDVVLTVSNPPPLNTTANVTFSIYAARGNLACSSGYRAEIVFPGKYGDGFEWVGERPTWRGNLSKGESVEINGTFKSTEIGNWTIVGHVFVSEGENYSFTWKTNYDGVVIINESKNASGCCGEHLYISVSEDTAYISENPFSEYKPATEQEFNETYAPALPFGFEIMVLVAPLTSVIGITMLLKRKKGG